MRDFKPIVKVSRTLGPYTREENRVAEFCWPMHTHTFAPGGEPEYAYKYFGQGTVKKLRDFSLTSGQKFSNFPPRFFHNFTLVRFTDILTFVITFVSNFTRVLRSPGRRFTSSSDAPLACRTSKTTGKIFQTTEKITRQAGFSRSLKKTCRVDYNVDANRELVLVHANRRA